MREKVESRADFYEHEAKATLMPENSGDPVAIAPGTDLVSSCSVECMCLICFDNRMPIQKKRDHQTESRLLLEADDAIELPPAEVSDNAIIVQFEKFKPFIPELLNSLRAGTIAEPVAVMNDGSSFAIHGETRTFWVKIWHAAGTELTKVERVQIISCIPSTQGLQVIVDDDDDDAGDE
jgi:hypothetical protein